MECQFRSKEFHYTLLFVLAVVLQSRVYLCWGAPVVTSPAGSTVAPSAMDIEGSNDTTTTCTTATVNTTVSSSEEQGDEFAGLQELRSGLKVLNIIAVRKRAMAY